jgi:hypothetical protein
MKNWILWSFSRGSFQYDMLCGLILLAIFVIPRDVFQDRPDYMRLPQTGDIRVSVDDDQNQVYTVKVGMTSPDLVRSELREAALLRLQAYLGREERLETFRVEPVPDSWGSTAAYAIWVK